MISNQKWHNFADDFKELLEKYEATLEITTRYDEYDETSNNFYIHFSESLMDLEDLHALIVKR